MCNESNSPTPTDCVVAVSAERGTAPDATPRPSREEHLQAPPATSMTALLRLLALLPFDRAGLPASPRFLLLLGTLVAAGWVLVDAYARRPVSAFVATGFVDLAWFGLGALSVAAVATAFARGRLPFVRALLLVLLCAPAWVLLYSLLPPWAELDVRYTAQRGLLFQLSMGQKVVLVLCAWSALILLRGLHGHLAVRAWPLWFTLLAAVT